MPTGKVHELLGPMHNPLPWHQHQALLVFHWRLAMALE